MISFIHPLVASEGTPEKTYNDLQDDLHDDNDLIMSCVSRMIYIPT